MRATVCLLLGLTFAALENASTARASATDSVAVSHGRVTWTLLPIVFSSPDTRFGIGVLPQIVYRMSPSARASSARVEAYATQERQFNVAIFTNLWLPGNQYVVGGRIRAREWPTSFYTTGNKLDRGEPESYTERLLQVSVEGRRRLLPGAYIGLQYDSRWFSIRTNEAEGRVVDRSVPGSVDGVLSGAGLQFVVDTRDEVFYPRSGNVLSLSASVYGPLFGSDLSFRTLTFDARRYFAIGGRHVVALQGAIQQTDGAVPFQVMPGMGEVLRGFKAKSLNDRNMLAVQAEYRIVPIWWRLGLAIFVGAGQVAPRLDRFSLSRFHFTAGAGVRFQVVRSENVHVRWDYGFSNEGVRDYLDIDEAF